MTKVMLIEALPARFSMNPKEFIGNKHFNRKYKVGDVLEAEVHAKWISVTITHRDTVYTLIHNRRYFKVLD